MRGAARVTQWVFAIDVLAAVVLLMTGVQGWFMTEVSTRPEDQLIRMYASLRRVCFTWGKRALLAVIPLFVVTGTFHMLAR